MSSEQMERLETYFVFIDGDEDEPEQVYLKSDVDDVIRGYRQENESCIWTYQDHFGYYETSCGADWQFVDGGMKANGVHYCMNCGRPAEERTQDE